MTPRDTLIRDAIIGANYTRRERNALAVQWWAHAQGRDLVHTDVSRVVARATALFDPRWR